LSHILELLGKGLQGDLGRQLARYFWAPQTQSIEQLKALCQQKPNEPETHLRLGLAYLRAEQTEEALEHLRQACRLKPDWLGARLALASAYDEAGKTAQALEQLEIGNQNTPGEVPLLFAIGFCHEKLRRPAKAMEYYRDAIERDGEFLAARERLAAVAILLDDVDQALEQYEAMRQAYPDDGWIRSALAHLYYRRGDYGRAVEEFETAIALEPENWSLQDDEIEALVAEGLLRDAIERLHGLIDHQGPFADLYVRLADLYSKTGDDKAAMKYYRLALEVEPDYLEAMVKLGTQHLVCGRWEEAAEAFHAASELNERLLSNYVGMGVAQGAKGDRAEAINSFELAAAIEPNTTLLLAEVARLQLKSALAEEFIRRFEGDDFVPAPDISLDNDDLLRKQIDCHRQELARHPNYPDLRYRYGVLLRAEGRGAEAMEQFAEAVKLNPTYVQAIIKLGITQQELGLTEQAIETFTKALELRPEYVDLHYRLGILYTDHRRFAEAVKHMEAAAAGAPDNTEIRVGLALSLQNMGLMDRAAATWRSLCRTTRAVCSKNGP